MGRVTVGWVAKLSLSLLLAIAVAIVAVILGFKEADSLREGSGFKVPISLEGTNVLITGASSGIGYSTAVRFCRLGAHVVMHGPNPNRTQRALQELRTEVMGACKVDLLVGELDDYKEVHAMAAKMTKMFKQLHILILNAGLHYGGPPRSADGSDWHSKRLRSHNDSHFVSKHGQDHVMGVNHFGHFLLTRLLMPILTPDVRIVVVTGGGMWEGDWRRLVVQERIPWEKYRLKAHGAYYDSKFANVCFGRALRERLSPAATVIVHDPGMIETGMTIPRGTGLYQKRRFSRNSQITWLDWAMSADESGELLLQSTFTSRPVPDLVYTYWVPKAIMRYVDDIRLVPQGKKLRSKILGFCLRRSGMTYGPLYAGIGPGCGDKTFLSFFWNHSLVMTGRTDELDMGAYNAYRAKYIHPLPPAALVGFVATRKY